MIIKLNLLSPADKKRIAKNIACINWINALAYLSLTVILVSGALYLGAKSMENKISRLRQIELSSSLDQEIMAINGKMRQAKELQKDFVKWSRVLTDITQTIPAGNIIISLKLDQINERISLAGTAAARDDFLRLKQSWEESGLVSNLESPISNLLYQHNVDFSLSGKLNLE